jgi:hypothetical protein
MLRLLDAGRLAVLYGASGTGKTSLLRAGVLPRLATDRYTVVTVRLLEGEPTQTLKAVLRRQLTVVPWAMEQSLVECVHTAAQAWGTTIVIVLDQFEEFFLRFPHQVREAFAQELGACVADTTLACALSSPCERTFMAIWGSFRTPSPTSSPTRGVSPRSPCPRPTPPS